MDPSLRRLASQRHGLTFTTAEARQCGYNARELSNLVNRKQAEHLGRGLYAVAAHDLSVDERHRRLAEGVLLQYPDGWLSYHSAVAAHGLPTWGANLRRAIVQRPVDNERLSKHCIVRPQELGIDPVRTPLGLAVPVAHSVVQHTMESGVAAGVVSVDAALHAGLVTTQALEQVAEPYSGWPYFGRVKSVLAHADGRSESVGESRLRLDLAMGGIRVVPQVVITDRAGRFVARVDLLVEGTNVIIEFDGLVKYRDGGADALVAEKRREDELRALGYVVLRVTWSELRSPASIIARVRSATRAAS